MESAPGALSSMSCPLVSTLRLIDIRIVRAGKGCLVGMQNFFFFFGFRRLVHCGGAEEAGFGAFGRRADCEKKANLRRDGVSLWRLRGEKVCSSATRRAG